MWMSIIYPLAMQNVDRTNYEERVQPIKTPASLFSKRQSRSPMSRARVQASPQTTSTPTVHPCENHPNKQGHYYTRIEGEELHFCEKCAITLASQGHSITRASIDSTPLSPAPSPSRQGSVAQSRLSTSRQASSSQVSSSKASSSQGSCWREQQIGGFLGQLNAMRGRVGQTRQAIKDKLIESQEFYGQQLEQVNSYFTLVMRSIELQKHKCYNHILKERAEAESHIRELDECLVGIDEGVTKMQLDIEDNLGTVYSIEQDMYRLVFEQYAQQQREFSETINGLLLTPIEMRRIEFEGVPESIHTISEAVIQNSLQNDAQQQYRLVDSLSSEDLAAIDAVSPRDPFRREEGPAGSVGCGDSLKFSFEGERLRGQLQMEH